jgi:hypothetical protein
MHESSVYQALLEEDREEGREQGQLLEARRIVVELGTAKLGAPDLTATSAIESLDDLDALHRLIRGVLHASSWQELLALLPDR